MKVCLANDSFPPLIDGVSNTVVNYGRVITEKYGSAIVATPRYPDVVDDYPFEVVRYTSLNTVKLVGYRTGYPFSHDAMERLSAFGPDIIHSHCPLASLFLCRELRDITHVPLILTYHTKFDMDIKRSIKLKLVHEPAINEMIHNIGAADDVWVVNRGAGENLKSLGFEGDYIVMPNGVDIDRTPADAALVASIERDCGLADGVPTLLFVGRVMWYKGLRIILDGLKLLKDAGQPFRMIFVGSGDNLEDVKACAAELGLADDCVFPGPVYDRALLKAYYSRADMFLLPSVFDNNPLVVKEAAACGTASLLIRDSSSAEGVEHGDNGVLIGESAEELARELAALLPRPEAMRRMGERAAETLYVSWEDSIANAMKRYDEVLLKCSEEGYAPARARYDTGIRLIGEIYQGIIKAKIRGSDLKNEFKTELESELQDLREGYDSAITWVKGKYDQMRDHFDRYQ